MTNDVCDQIATLKAQLAKALSRAEEEEARAAEWMELADRRLRQIGQLKDEIARLDEKLAFAQWAGQ